MTRIVLASNSPRRKELLERVGLEFSVDASSIDEVVRDHETPEQIAMGLALEKGLDVASRHEDGTLIIAADTIVYKDEVMGKPQDAEDAKKMLSSLSGTLHQVYTGFAIIEAGTNKKIVDFECTDVQFKDLSQEKINHYVESGEAYGKAGAYAIQGKGMTLVKWIKGDFFNVVGLPVSKLETLLEKHFGMRFI